MVRIVILNTHNLLFFTLTSVAVIATAIRNKDTDTLTYVNPKNVDSMCKIVLSVKNSSKLIKLSETLKTAKIDHKLWIEQPEDIPTSLATKPYKRKIVKNLFQKLALLQ